MPSRHQTWVHYSWAHSKWKWKEVNVKKLKWKCEICWQPDQTWIHYSWSQSLTKCESGKVKVWKLLLPDTRLEHTTLGHTHKVKMQMCESEKSESVKAAATRHQSTVLGSTQDFSFKLSSLSLRLNLSLNIVLPAQYSSLPPQLFHTKWRGERK